MKCQHSASCCFTLAQNTFNQKDQSTGVYYSDLSAIVVMQHKSMLSKNTQTDVAHS